MAQEIYRRRPEASGTKGDIKSKQLTPRYAGSSVAQEGWLLFEDEGRAADLFGFEGDGDFDVVGDFDEGDAAVHAVIFAIENHFAVDVFETCGFGG
ncbi:MAG TPA: hypothetical protein VKR52_03630, partial [Terracidiphilus sp.]|nr:hypothetical protein [Terracidiphilus sp.]